MARSDVPASAAFSAVLGPAGQRRVGALPLIVLLISLAGVAGVCQALAIGKPAVAAPTPASTGSGVPAEDKYYVVGPPVDGQPEHLFTIAAETLGDGRRYREIFELNRNRVQPDGKRMTDPVVETGWILLLPADARGPRVRTGAPAGFSPSGITGAPMATGPPAVATVDSDLALRIGLVAVAVVLVMVALLVLRSGRLRIRPRAAAADRSSSTELDRQRPQTTQPAVPLCAAEPSVAPPRQRPAGDLSAAGSAPVHLLAETALSCAGDHGTIRLIGCRTGEGPGYVWLRSDRRPSDGQAAVVLGEGDRGRLWVDLALTPDVFTITGRDREAALRVVRTVIDQIRAAGVPLTLVGPVLGEELPDGCRFVSSVAHLPDLPVSGEDPAAAHVVVCALGPRQSLTAVHRWMRASGTRVIPVLVGDVPSARWSLKLAGSAREGPRLVNRTG